MPISWEPKRPEEVRRRVIDWSSWLDGDTIASSLLTVDGVTLDNDPANHTDTTVAVEFSGGTDGTRARITNTITAAGGDVETEIFTVYISESAEPINLAQVKDHLRVRHDDEDAKISGMIPRSRLWVEDHTGLALVQREFVERLLPVNWAIRLSKGPLVSVDEVAYIDQLGADQVYAPRANPPTGTLYPIAGENWPALQEDERFEVTYTAGFDIGEADDRLIGAMLALIEGEYAEGYAYPERATDAAERCCAYLRQMVA